ncbi:MAG: MGMT family protein [Candidatus Omnitrophica bacterium]|nr:MGMT family protein [Candidatus Omnitrophota bacterium]MCM8777272.1 MGMT family protein [Candidatus Omnitrophota bacterium]
MSKNLKRKDTIKNKVMQAVSEIPFGRTITYSQLAEKVGMKGKIRYVSTFLKENPYPVAIPCHRVIRKDGSYGKYILGRRFKRYLIEWEKNLIKH